MSFSHLGSISSTVPFNFDTVNFLTTPIVDTVDSVTGPNGILVFTSPFGNFDVGTVTTVLMAGATPANDASNVYADAPDDAGGNPQHYAISKSQTISQISFFPFNTVINNNFGLGGTDPTLGSIFGQTAVELLMPSIAANFDGTDLNDVMTLPSIGGELFGDDGDDSLTGSDVADTILGDNNLNQSGNDTIHGLGGNDTLDGGMGEDLIRGGDGDDVVRGGGTAGNDFDLLEGNDGNDHLSVIGQGNARGDDGNDTIEAITNGNDFVIADHAGDPAGIIANLTAVLRDGVAGGDTVNGFFVQDGYGDIDTLFGIHTIRGTSSNDVFYVDGTFMNSFGNWIGVRPGDGDDVMTFINVTGTARVDYRSSTGPVQADLEAGTAQDVTPGSGDIGNDSWTGANEFRGSQSDDIILGRLDDDRRIRGHDGNDSIDGRGGNDRIDGESGNDTINGGAGSDNLSGGSGEDSIDGGGAQQNEFDFLDGGSGHDFLSITGFGSALGSEGNDFIQGVTLGNVQTGDFVGAQYFDSPAGIAANLTATMQFGVAGGTNATGYFVEDGFGTIDTIVNLQRIEGTDFGDLFALDAGYMQTGGNWIEFLPGGGDDVITAIGTDQVFLIYDNMNGPLVADLEAGTATDLVPGASVIGNDTFDPTSLFRGTTFGDSIDGSLGGDGRIEGNGGNDTINGRSGGDYLIGGEGNDVLIGGGANDDLGEFDFLDGGAGDDDLSITGDGAALGSMGDDTLRGFQDGDPNTFEFNRAEYFDSTVGIVANLTGSAIGALAGGNATSGFLVSDGHGTMDNLLGIYAIGGTGFDDQFYADSTYQGVDGNAVEFAPEGGNDMMDATGVAFFSVNYFGLTSGVLADLEAGTATDLVNGAGVIGNDTFTPADQFFGTFADDQVSGSARAEFIIGDQGNDLLEGLGGDDGFDGGDGADTLRGGEGTDFLNGGFGADVLDGGDDFDVADYLGADARIEIDLAKGIALGSFAEGDTLIDIEAIFATNFNDKLVGDGEDNDFSGWGGNDNLNGQGGNDSIAGDDGDDLISGGSGNDTLNGFADNDQIFGNGNNDLIFGGSGEDTIFGGAGADDIDGGTENDEISGQSAADTITGGEGMDTIRGGSGNDSIEGGDHDDLLFGNGNNDTVRGGDGDDVIQGAAGADRLFGDAGDDVLTGSIGGDVLDGGTGNDTMNGGGADNARDRFVFRVDYDQDRINSFDQGSDRIQLDQNLWIATNPGLTEQEVVDTFGTSNGTGSIVTLTFANGDILEIQSAGGLDQSTLGLDVQFI